MNRAQAMEVLAGTSQKVAFLTAGMTDEQLSVQLNLSEWSMKTIVGHLAAAEEKVFHPALRRIKKESNPTFDKHDPDEWAMGFDDRELLSEMLARFNRFRLATIASLNRLPEEDWHLTGVHPERGPTTMEREVIYVAEHDLRHLSRLTALRRAVLGHGPTGA